MNWKGVAAGIVLGTLGWGGYNYVLPFLLPGGLLGPCGYETLSKASSPDWAFDAALIEVNCGATTAYSSRLYIAPSGAAIDPDKEDPVARFKGSAARVEWVDGKLIVHLGDATPVVKPAVWRDVPIVYEAGPKTSPPGPFPETLNFE